MLNSIFELIELNFREKRMKTYILICGFADVVAGGPIYYANKVRYMEQLGW